MDSWDFKATETLQNVPHIICFRGYRIYPHLTLQYPAWASDARGIAMLRVGKFSYLGKQTRGTNNIALLIKRHVYIYIFRERWLH